MASKALYTGVAVIGIAAASGAAWWFQSRPSSPAAQGPADAGRGAAAPAAGASAPARPPVVEVARVEVMRLTDDTQAVGSLRSRQSVVLRPEVSGRVTQLNFRDGDRVRKGQLLVQLDDQLPQAQLKQSQAELSIAQANHRRNQELVAQNFISKRSVDESAANLEVAQAKLALAEATLARLKIVAPFNAIAGIRSVNIGDYLKDGADVVNLEDIDAVYVDFRLPERFQSKVRKGQQAAVELDALPGRKFNAVIEAIDPLIDANGRSVGIRGCIDNRALQLRPGMYARVNAVFGVRERALVVPEEAIVPQGQRQFVYRLLDGPQGKTSQRVEVKLGIRRPGRVEIVDGLNENDLVVTAGQQRLQRDGMPVRLMEGGGRGGAGAAAASASASASASAPAAGASAAAGLPDGNGSRTAAARPAVSAAAAPVTAANAKGTAGAKAPAGKVEGPNPCTVARG